MICVYKHFDANGTLLYIGSTIDFFKRCTDHKKSPWATRVARIEVHPVANSDQAILLEHKLIKKEQPQFNVHIKYSKTKNDWSTANAAKVIAYAKEYVKSESTKKVIEFAALGDISPAILLALMEDRNEYFSYQSLAKIINAFEYLGIRIAPDANGNVIRLYNWLKKDEQEATPA
jgi:predicted GIY-YIG superfamily endonuclease